MTTYLALGSVYTSVVLKAECDTIITECGHQEN